MRYLKRYKHLTKVQTLFLCSSIILSLLCWGIWEMVFSVLGVLFELIKGVV